MSYVMYLYTFISNGSKSLRNKLISGIVYVRAAGYYLSSITEKVSDIYRQNRQFSSVLKADMGLI